MFPDGLKNTTNDDVAYVLERIRGDDSHIMHPTTVTTLAAAAADDDPCPKIYFSPYFDRLLRCNLGDDGIPRRTHRIQN